MHGSIGRWTGWSLGCRQAISVVFPQRAFGVANAAFAPAISSVRDPVSGLFSKRVAVRTSRPRAARRPMTTFRRHVPNVFRLRAETKVCRLDTTWVVAQVHDDLAGRDFAELQRPGDSVCPSRFSVPKKIAVAVQGARPEPDAAACFRHLNRPLPEINDSLFVSRCARLFTHRGAVDRTKVKGSRTGYKPLRGSAHYTVSYQQLQYILQ